MQDVIYIWFSHRICQKHEEIKDTVRSTPQNTEELLSLSQYIEKTSDVTIHKLRDEIDEAACRMIFLMDYANLPGMSQPYRYSFYRTVHLLMLFCFVAWVPSSSS